MLIDIAISGGRNVSKKVAKKILKYKDLTVEIQCIHSFIHSVVCHNTDPLPSLQSEFSTECDLVLPVSIYNIPSVP